MALATSWKLCVWIYSTLKVCSVLILSVLLQIRLHIRNDISYGEGIKKEKRTL